jgi:glycosyltransferase involved in cell wall biosynthesis
MSVEDATTCQYNPRVVHFHTAAKALWWALTPWRLPERLEARRRRAETVLAETHRAAARLEVLKFIREQVQLDAEHRRRAGAKSGAYLDLFDDVSVQAAVGPMVQAIPWESQQIHSVEDLWSAVRWCIELLRKNADIRLRFPRALSDGAGGRFAAWIATEGGDGLGLPSQARRHVLNALASDVSAKARQAFLFEEDVRDVLPHGLTPAGWAQLLPWFLLHGRKITEVRAEEIWWLFLAAAEDPPLELTRAWLSTPDWQQRHPDGLTRFGRDAFSAWVGAKYGVNAEWLNPETWPQSQSPATQIRGAYLARSEWRARHPGALTDAVAAAGLVRWLKSPDSALPESVRDWCSMLDPESTAAELAALGVNVVGHFCYPSGLRTSVNGIVSSLQEAGVKTSLRDVRTDPRADEPHHIFFNGIESYDSTIIHVQPEPFFGNVYQRADMAPRSPRTHRIAYWYWELEDSVPLSWGLQARSADEVWAATTFVAEALRSQLTVPVHTLMSGMELPPLVPRARAHFGLQQGVFTFLFVFHLASIMERKNPLGLIAAFKEAFGSREPVHLVLKMSYSAQHAESLETLRRAAAGFPNITIMCRTLSADDTLALMNTCDAYVSLHRSEGLGLTMAEAMMLGKPVIATRYSGNLDFMNDTNSLLVDYELVQLGTDFPPYAATGRWAEPSIKHAAQLMRRIFENQTWAKALGSRAKADAEITFSYKAAGQRFAKRLREISDSPK